MKVTQNRRRIKARPVRRVYSSSPTSTPKPLFSLAECQMIKNIAFAVLFYEGPEGLLFKRQAQEIIKKLQPIT